MLSKLKNVLWSHQDPPVLQEGEEILLEGQTVLIASVGGGRVGPLRLTDRRLMWYEPSVARPLPHIAGEVKLSDVASVEPGTWLGAGLIRLRLHSGKRKNIRVLGGRRDDWVTAIRIQLGTRP
jgi:hypothetical protein